MLQRPGLYLLPPLFILASAASPAGAQLVLTNIALFNSSDLNSLVGTPGNMVEQRSLLELVSQEVSEEGHPVFTVRFTLLVAADQDGPTQYRGFPSNSSHQGRFNIAFDVVAVPGAKWQLYIETSRKGAVDLVYDETFPTAFATAGPIEEQTSVVATGVTLGSGSLTLPAFDSLQGGGTATSAFDQWIFARTTAATGSRHVELDTVLETYSAGSLCSGPSCWGQEAAVRMGIGSSLPGFTAGDYPGIGGRNAAEDGYYVRIELSPLGEVTLPPFVEAPMTWGAGLALCLGSTGFGSLFGFFGRERRANGAA